MGRRRSKRIEDPSLGGGRPSSSPAGGLPNQAREPVSGGRVTTFGRHLLERGVLSRAQLEEATQVMVVFGGRLGTILVESGVLTLEQVEEQLARHLDLPCAPRERLIRPDPTALELVGAGLAQPCSVFPRWT